MPNEPPEKIGKRDAAAAASLPIGALFFPVLRLDHEGVIVASNGVLERELALPAATLGGRRLMDVVASESRADAASLAHFGPREPLELCFGQVPTRRTFYVARDGEDVWLIGQPAELDAAHDDVSQGSAHALASPAEYARASAAKTRFLATMSHELRTPLNAVLGYAGLLRDGVYGAVGERQRQAIDSIVRRAKDLQLMIDDVLDLSKLESGRMALRLEDFDPGQVLAEVMDSAGSAARAKELTVTVRRGLGRTARLDRSRYKQIVLNLVSNAIKFTPPGGEIVLSVNEGPGNSFVTRVRDTGIGIAPEHLRRIFENFQQIDDGTTRRFQGIGLGLSIVRQTVNLLGGAISVESVPEHGATFAVTLPLHPDREIMASAVAEGSTEQAAAGAPVVLAIDDDPEVIALLRDSLKPAHFRVVGALNGSRGLELARMLKPFAITLDIMMREKDGWQVLREIKADATLRHIPVIVMSIIAERALGFSLGVTDYVVKPVDRRVLIGLLERLRRQVVSTALVVDENYDSRTLMRDLLTSMGLEVRLASSGAEALEALDAEPPAVLFLAHVPDEQGVTRLLDELSSDRRFEKTRIVVVARSDGEIAHPEWMQRAAAAVVHSSTGRSDELMRELREVLATLATDGNGATRGAPTLTQS